MLKTEIAKYIITAALSQSPDAAIQQPVPTLDCSQAGGISRVDNRPQSDSSQPIEVYDNRTGKTVQGTKRVPNNRNGEIDLITPNGERVACHPSNNAQTKPSSSTQPVR